MNKFNSMSTRITLDDIKRFETKFLKYKSCWEYTGGIGTTGRGMFWLNGKTEKAHRVSWMIYKGEIPKGLLVCHKCDNGKCVNPEHLFLGTHKDNTQDMMRKGRNVGNKKLSDLEIGQIKTLFHCGMRRKDIASIYKKVRYEQIWRITKG